MRHLLTFWICLTLISGYCLSISAQETAQPAAQAASAKKKKEFEDFSKVTADSKKLSRFLSTLPEKREPLLRNTTLTIRPTFPMHDQPFARLRERIPHLRDDDGGVVARLAAGRRSCASRPKKCAFPR